GQHELQEVLQEWNHVWHTSRPVLRVSREGPRLRIIDTRPGALQRNWISGELETEVYDLCDSAQTPAPVLKEISARRGAWVSAQEVEKAIQALCDAKVLLQMNGKLLGLGVF